MSGHPPPNYGYGSPPPPNPNQNPHSSTPYGAPPSPNGSQSHQSPTSAPYSGSNVQHVSHVGPPPSPSPSQYNQTAAPYGGQQQSPFSSLLPSVFPPGTDPNVVACFQLADKDRSGFIDDKELQEALSGYNQRFSLRTVHLLMYLFTNSNSRKIGTCYNFLDPLVHN